MGIWRALALSWISELATALNGVEWEGDLDVSFGSGVTYAFSYVFRKVGCSYGSNQIADDVLLPNIGKRTHRGNFCGLICVAEK